MNNARRVRIVAAVLPSDRWHLRASAGIGALLLLAAGGSAALGQAARARATRTVSVRDRAELYAVRSYGNTLIEEGKATGTLAGTVKIRLNIDAARRTATAGFTIYTRGGSLSGGSSGSAHGGHGGWESFSGRMWLDHGTGRYRSASGSGKLYGSIYRRTDRLIVQEIGRLRY
jgi:hypothetical protein